MIVRLITVIIFTLLISTTHKVMSQEIMRIEIPASDLSLPFYTIPLEDNGVIIFRGVEIKSRRIIRWKLIHYDVAFQELYRKKFNTERSGRFTAFETGENHVALFFMRNMPQLSGDVIVYNFKTLSDTTISFNDPDILIQKPFFLISDNNFFIGGMIDKRSRGLSAIVNIFSRDIPDEEIFILTGCMQQGKIVKSRDTIPDLTKVAHVQTYNNRILLALRISTGKFSENISIVEYDANSGDLKALGALSTQNNKYLIDLCFIKQPDISLAISGTYGTRSKKSWRRGEQVAAQGIFFTFIDTTISNGIKYYHFNTFTNLTSKVRQRFYRGDFSSPRQQSSRGISSYRMLLHEQPYSVDDEIIVVGEAYYPEYEYERRIQPYSFYPYRYYGYYPGFYDYGSRWVFKGFRYDHAIAVAFDKKGNLIWENGFETSNILEQSLSPRLNILPYAGEVVMVYAYDGRIWFRVIRADDVVVDKESYPVELPSVEERIRENYSMNMTKWYDRFFLVYGRHSIIDAYGRTRIVYYCNKLAFE